MKTPWIASAGLAVFVSIVQYLLKPDRREPDRPDASSKEGTMAKVDPNNAVWSMTLGKALVGRPITNQSLCGATPPQGLGWIEPRPATWGFSLGRGVRWTDSEGACG